MIKFIILFSTIILSQCSTFITNEEEFKIFALSNNKFFLTLCNELKDSNCVRLAPIFDKAITRAKHELNIDLNSVFINNKLNKVLQLDLIYEGFPTIYFFSNNGGKLTGDVYLGAKSHDGLLNFLRKSAPRQIQKISSFTEVKGRAKENSFFLVLPKEVTYNPQIINEAAKNCGVFEIYEASDVQANEMIIMTDKMEEGSIEIESFDTLDAMTLTHLLLLKIRQGLLTTKQKNPNEFNILSEADVEFTLGNHPIPTIYFIYENKKEFTPSMEEELNQIANKYSNEFAFIKSSSNTKLIKKLQFDEYFDLKNKNDLPKFILTTENPNDDDDVVKSVLPKSQFYKKSTEATDQTQDQVENSTVALPLGEVLEKFINNFQLGKLPSAKVKFDYEESKLDGENFELAINNEVTADNEVLLLLAPFMSQKEKRIRVRLERVFEKLYEINEKKLAIDEFDPFLNEISTIRYDYLPQIVLIKRNPDEFALHKWDVLFYKGELTTKGIVDWTRKNSKVQLKEKHLEDEENIFANEAALPLYPVHKKRFEGTILPDVPELATIGLKRRWQKVKRQRQSNVSFDFLNSGNEYYDDENDFEIDDDVDETKYAKNAEDL